MRNGLPQSTATVAERKSQLLWRRQGPKQFNCPEEGFNIETGKLSTNI